MTETISTHPALDSTHPDPEPRLPTVPQVADYGEITRVVREAEAELASRLHERTWHDGPLVLALGRRRLVHVYRVRSTDPRMGLYAYPEDVPAIAGAYAKGAAMIQGRREQHAREVELALHRWLAGAARAELSVDPAPDYQSYRYAPACDGACEVRDEVAERKECRGDLQYRLRVLAAEVTGLAQQMEARRVRARELRARAVAEGRESLLRRAQIKDAHAEADAERIAELETERARLLWLLGEDA